MLLRKLLQDVKHYLHLDDYVYEVNEWNDSEFLVESQKMNEETERNEGKNRRENRLFIICYSSCSMFICSWNDNFFYLVSWFSLRLLIVYSQADSYVEALWLLTVKTVTQ